MTSDKTATTGAKPYLVAITGSIACGKSTIGKQLESLGVPVIDTDLLAHELLNTPNPAYQAVLDRFGADLADKPGAPINREKLRAAAFKDDKSKADLESILHPAIEQLLAKKIDALKGKPVVFVQVPLLFEAKLEGRYDEIWCVLVDRDTQLTRLKTRNGLSDDEAKKRIALQWPQEKKAANSHRIIDNSGKPEDTLTQVKQALLKANGVAVKAEPAPEPVNAARNDEYKKLLKRGANLATAEALDRLGDVSTTRHKDAAAEMVMRVTACETATDGSTSNEEHQLTVRLQMCVKHAKGPVDTTPCKDPGCACKGNSPTPKPGHCGCDNKQPPSPPCPPAPPCPPPPPPCPPPAPRPDGQSQKNSSGGLLGLFGFLAFAILVVMLQGLITGHKDSTSTTTVIVVNPPCQQGCEKPKPPTPPTPQPTPACPGICKPTAAPPEPPVTPPVSEGCSEARNPSSTAPAFALPYLHNQVRVRTTEWTVRCKGDDRGAIVVGRDNEGRLTNWQDYGPNLRFTSQWIVNYARYGGALWVDLFEAPNQFMGRTLYQYSQSGTLLEVRRLDNQQRPMYRAVLERTVEGRLCRVVVQRFNEYGVVVDVLAYRPDAPELASDFYLYELFGQIK